MQKFTDQLYFLIVFQGASIQVTVVCQQLDARAVTFDGSLQVCRR